MASNNHKRTHSAMVMFGEPSYSSPAAKRARADTADEKEASPISRIESLPTEILELIFFGSLNGNLLRASPRIAVKLSRSKTIYRTAFLVAFYHPNILELRKAFKFQYLLPDLQTPIPSWEVRSMQKIVLDSRWCTFGWFKSQASELLDYACDLYRNVYAKDLPSGCSARLGKLLKDRRDLLGLRYSGSGGLDSNRQYNELVVDPFNLVIKVRPEEEEDADTDEACEKVRRWALPLRGVGSVCLRSGLLANSYHDDDHFRMLVDQAILSLPDGVAPHPSPNHRWEYMETAMLEAILNRDLDILQELLEIDYFFWPEDAPFKVDPRLFLAAIQKYNLGALNLLFQVDPTSLPRSDERVIAEAAMLSKGKALLRKHRLRDRMLRRRRRARGEIFSDEVLQNAARLDSWMEYRERSNAAISDYVRTGYLTEETNTLSPDFILRTKGTSLTPEFLQRMKGTSVGEVCDSRIFGFDDETFGEDESGYSHEAIIGEGSYHSTANDWPLTGESDIDYLSELDDSEVWDEETDDFDMYEEWIMSESGDKEAPSTLRPNGIDWKSVYLRAGRDWPLGMERKEEYHYMMP